jgi:hypothetical protein
LAVSKKQSAAQPRSYEEGTQKKCKCNTRAVSAHEDQVAGGDPQGDAEGDRREAGESP